MAWTNLLNALFLPGKPILGSTGVALRDNLISALLGESGAQRMLLPGLERLEAGTAIRMRDDAEFTSSVTSYSNRISFGVIQYGMIRVAWEYRRDNGSAQVNINRNRAGAITAVTSPLTSSVTYVSATADVDVIPGDTITIQFRQNVSASGPAYIRNLRVQTNGQDLWPAPTGIAIEGNRAAP